MKFKVFASIVALCFAISAHAAGWSLREKSFIKAIPPTFGKHAGGIVASPSDVDVADAIALGAASKEKPEILEYAYLIKEQTSFFSTEVIYIRIATPAYLIAQHAYAQAREYRPVDDSFIAYAKKARAVRISLTNQFLNSRYQALAFHYDVILLRDGMRVEPLKEIPSWNGSNPFAEPSAFSNQPAMAAVQRAAAQSMRASMAAMNDDQKAVMVRQLSATGWSDAKIREAFGWSQAELAKIRGDAAAPAGAPSMVPLTDADGVFSCDELRKPGKYELVFRKPKIVGFGELKDQEVRFAVSFDRFR